MIPLDQMIRFDRLRERTANAIAYELQQNDGACKSYEGTWEVLISFPDYFSDNTASSPPDFTEIRLHCYVLGPHRHYEWKGDTFFDALLKAEAEIDSWIEHQKEEY